MTQMVDAVSFLHHSESLDASSAGVSSKIEVSIDSVQNSKSRQRGFSFDRTTSTHGNIIRTSSALSLLTGEDSFTQSARLLDESPDDQLLEQEYESTTPSPIYQPSPTQTYQVPGSMAYQVPGGIIPAPIPLRQTSPRYQVPGQPPYQLPEINLSINIPPHHTSPMQQAVVIGDPSTLGYFRVNTPNTNPATPSYTPRGSNIEPDDVDDATIVTKRSLISRPGQTESHPVIIDPNNMNVFVPSNIGNFSFDLAQLAVSRNIARGLHLDDMVGVEYITTGSNSHIFGATWNNQAVVIKVWNVFFLRLNKVIENYVFFSNVYLVVK